MIPLAATSPLSFRFMNAMPTQHVHLDFFLNTPHV